MMNGTNPSESIPAGLLKTFEFTTEDHARILLTDSLFDGDNITAMSSNIDDLTKSLKKLVTRETRQYLHAVCLSDYLRKRIIPRGLRIQKAPAFGYNNPQFLDRWCEILNKCSLDLMALTIQETTEQLRTTRDEIQQINSRLDTELTDKKNLDSLKREIELLKEKHQSEIKMTKRRKFARDTNDYKQQNVYFWRKSTDAPSTQPQGGRIRQQARYQDDWPSSSSVDSDSQNSSTFLDRSPQQPHRGRPRGRPRGRGHTRGGDPRGRNAVGGGSRGGPHYQTRLHLTR